MICLGIPISSVNYCNLDVFVVTAVQWRKQGDPVLQRNTKILEK